MQIFKTFFALRQELEKAEGPIGFVPTMGALHAGHLTLIGRAVQENEHAVVSIFVNPTQFNDPNDLDNYPRRLEQDLEALSSIEENLSVIIPSVQEVYGDDPQVESYDLGTLSRVMEGQMRPGHFQGVATVVEKLLQAVRPHRAYFGEKDFQQYRVIERLVELKEIPVELIQCPVEREDHGLARSSRNELLSPEGRKNAGQIYRLLQALKSDFYSQQYSYIDLKDKAQLQFSKIPNSNLEYFVIASSDSLTEIQSINDAHQPRAFVAIQVEKIRLIDTMDYQE